MPTEQAKGTDQLGVGVSAPLHENTEWKALWTVERFDVPIEWYAERLIRSRATQDDAERMLTALQTTGDWSKLDAWVQIEADRLLRAQNIPDASTFENNLLNAGITLVWNLVIGTAATANTGASAPAAVAVYNNAQSRLAIGDSSTAFAASQTWLQAATNKYAQVMDATYPSVSAQTVTFKTTVTSANANYAWQEFVTDNGGGSNSTSTTFTGSAALNRAVSNQGTKASGQTWALTETVTLS